MEEEMTAYIIDNRNVGHVLKTNRRNPSEAICDLYERVIEPIEVRREGATREPWQIGAEELMACREVIEY
jgi:hypothetical protein